MLGITTTDRASSLTDEEVILRSRREPWLFAVLIDRYEAAFLRKAESILRNREDAEEVVQEAFTKIYLHSARFEVRDESSFSSWAYRIMINTAFTLYQKRKRERERVVALDPAYEQQFGSWSEHAGFLEDRDLIERILAHLPYTVAEILRMYYLERWSHKDIAAYLKTTVGAVKVRMHRARAAFKREACKRGASTVLCEKL